LETSTISTATNSAIWDVDADVVEAVEEMMVEGEELEEDVVEATILEETINEIPRTISDLATTTPTSDLLMADMGCPIQGPTLMQ
jgi:hypothetical protein